MVRHYFSYTVTFSDLPTPEPDGLTFARKKRPWGVTFEGKEHLMGRNVTTRSVQISAPDSLVYTCRVPYKELGDPGSNPSLFTISDPVTFRTVQVYNPGSNPGHGSKCNWMG